VADSDKKVVSVFVRFRAPLHAVYMYRSLEIEMATNRCILDEILRTVCSIYFVKVHVPETKGLLEEIEQKFKRIEADRQVRVSVGTRCYKSEIMCPGC
jgi:hypothetical protein